MRVLCEQFEPNFGTETGRDDGEDDAKTVAERKVIVGERGCVRSRERDFRDVVFERVHERDDGDVRWRKYLVVRVRVYAVKASALVEHLGRGGRGSDSADDGIRGGGGFEVDQIQIQR